MSIPSSPSTLHSSHSPSTASKVSHGSYWDALIVEAALPARATILYTEDMSHGTRYDSLELRNPFIIE